MVPARTRAAPPRAPGVAAHDAFRFHGHHECRVLTEAVVEHLPGAPRSGAIRRVRRGELIYAMGDPTGEVFFLRRGRVAISALAPDGRERRLLVVEPGEMFGELCFCDIRARQDQAVAVADSEIVAMRMDHLMDALLASRGGVEALLGTLCARVANAQAQIHALAFHTVPQRIGLLLLGLARADSSGREGGALIPAPPAHEEIAQSVSASRELVSSTLSGFRRLGLVRYRRRSAMVVHPEALRRHLGLPPT
ncbi:MAG: Crp/Fnr family transcriptional regulator [Armatimonadota bacterium]|nr:Crp/Fnr family transcriptional regulator [Armatimonadota bacterium]MDR7422687.1 Crp/Fnr family transcriptional regulator [Armatimonadota bacterium]MDR7455187.1 Crp/Fnr family transcriptional regulator [Armatimonadota bacterium]MDR7457410.1 Crp/Fnr family transcriptional regulator [Armatimonadota bacterium]MDR7497250.1 Crp/Fnr family transcriptional regulator [Armatimonadota bacterium]